MFKRTVNFIILFYFALLPPVIHAENQVIKLAFIGPSDHSASFGALQGLSEANLQGQFLGKQYTLDFIKSSDALSYKYDKYLAVITAVDKSTFIKVANQLNKMPVFNTILDDDDLRLDCRSNTLHVIPSLKMKEDALTQWRTENTDSKAVAQAWHYDFVKFAARDLNKRFTKQHKRNMDDHAWAGWAAIKMSADAIVRENITDSASLLDFLKISLAFDGQKGIDMKFRETGQLEQPVLLVENDKTVAEAPVRGVAKPPTVDSLGIRNCPK